MSRKLVDTYLIGWAAFCLFMSGLMLGFVLGVLKCSI